MNAGHTRRRITALSSATGGSSSKPSAATHEVQRLGADDGGPAEMIVIVAGQQRPYALDGTSALNR